METAVVMVILSWILKYKVNRWVTIVIGVLNILFSDEPAIERGIDLHRKGCSSEQA
jgi:hypothetical protein